MGLPSDLRFAAIGTVLQNKFYPEILSSGLPAVNGTFVSLLMVPLALFEGTL